MSKRFLPLMACLVVVLAGCNDSSTTTVVDVDCGLTGDELISSWTVDYNGTVSTLTTGCDVPADDNRALSVSTAAVTVASVFVTAADDSPSYRVEGDLGALYGTGGFELKAAVSVDTCIALVQIWEEDDKAFVQCIGELDRNSRIIQAFCDSAEVDANEDGNPDATCGIVASITANIILGP